MKKTIKALLVATIFAISMSAVAHEPSLTITHIQGIEIVPGEVTPLVVPFLPFDIPVEGDVSHVGQGNLGAVTMYATDNSVLFYGPDDPFLGSKEKNDRFNITWTPTVPGVHVITVTASHGEHSVSATLFESHSTEEKNVGCPAGPSIAVKYLNENDLGEYSLSKGNIISYVAKETGSTGILWARNSCDSTHEEDVISFVVEILEAD